MELSLIVPVYNREPYLVELLDKLCLGALRRQPPSDAELVLIDDASPLERETRGLAEEVSRWMPVTYHRNAANLGYVRSTNEGLARALGKRLLLCNSDARPTPEALARLTSVLEADPKVGMAGPVTNNAFDAPLQGTGTLEPLRSFSEEEFARVERFAQAVAQGGGKPVEARWLLGFCVLMRREVLDTVGPLDENFGLGYLEEVDYGLRARAQGWKLAVDPGAFVFHGGLKSAGVNGARGGSQTMRASPLPLLWNLTRNAAYGVWKHGWREWSRPQGFP